MRNLMRRAGSALYALAVLGFLVVGPALAAPGQLVTVMPGPVTITQTVVTLPAATSTPLVPANSNGLRRYLCWQVTGTGPMTVVPGTGPAVAGQGFNFDPGSTAINQGGLFCQESSTISQQAFTAISTAGTTAVVWEGQ